MLIVIRKTKEERTPPPSQTWYVLVQKVRWAIWYPMFLLQLHSALCISTASSVLNESSLDRSRSSIDAGY